MKKRIGGKIIGLAHIGLFISDIERTKEFYTNILNFKIAYKTSLLSKHGEIKICFLKLGSLYIEIVQLPLIQAKRSDGYFDHLAINVKNIEEVKKQLEKEGIKFEKNEITYVPYVWNKSSKWIFFRGPDNEHIEINEVLTD